MLRLEQMKIQGNVTCTSGVKEGIRQVIIPGNDTYGVYEDTCNVVYGVNDDTRQCNVLSK